MKGAAQPGSNRELCQRLGPSENELLVPGRGCDADSSSSLPQPPPGIPDYDLLRCIGRGSYGDVWLARNALGRFEAVKVIYRDRFTHRRPYEREFEGIRQYERTSRQHPSQVTLLHVGRDEEDRYYYYAMELADDAAAGKEMIPESYRPRTLDTELKERVRLPVSECIELGMALTRALRDLHGQQLIHRDIKPGNIIWVGGVPKLADIGLVAVKDSVMSLVGTRGFLPPEGPGSVPGDLYSLGKVLYEASTGQDRQDFPQLPTTLETWPEEEALLELNEVVLKACQTDPRRRYQSAREMQGDLAVLQSGKSVRQRHAAQRRLAVAAKIAVAGVGMAFVALVAALVTRGFTTPPSPSFTRLRMGEIPFALRPDRPPKFDFSPEGDRVAYGSGGVLSIWDRVSSLPRVVASREDLGWSPLHPRWSPKGDWIACVGQQLAPLNSPGSVAGLYRSQLIVNSRTGESRELATDFTTAVQWRPDGSGITYRHEGLDLHCDLRGQVTVWRRPDPSHPMSWPAYSPDDKWVAYIPKSAHPGVRHRNLWLQPFGGGPPRRLTDHPGRDTHPTWGPDSRTLYYVSTQNASGPGTWHLHRLHLDHKTGAARGKSEQLTFFEGDRVVYPKVLAGGQRIGFGLQGTINKILVGAPGSLKERIEGRSPQLSPDGRTVYFVGYGPKRKGLFRVPVVGEGLVRLFDPEEVAPAATAACYELSPDGSSIAFLGHDREGLGVFVVPSQGGRPTRLRGLLSEGQIHTTVPQWSPDGKWLAHADGGDLSRIKPDGTGHEALARLARWDSVRWSPDGRQIAGLGREEVKNSKEANAVFMVSVADRALRRLTPREEHRYKDALDWHPGGEFLTYYYRGPEDYGDQIRAVYLDGSPGKVLVDQSADLEDSGRWAPNGRHFYFMGLPFSEKGPVMHVLDHRTGQIEHVPEISSLPRWSRDGRTMTGVHTTTTRQLMLMEGF